MNFVGFLMAVVQGYFEYSGAREGIRAQMWAMRTGLGEFLDAIAKARKGKGRATLLEI
jgi:hypothetical protein